jgi:hypothetical protein
LFSLSDVLNTPKYTPNAHLLGRCGSLSRLVCGRGISAIAAASRAHQPQESEPTPRIRRPTSGGEAFSRGGVVCRTCHSVETMHRAIFSFCNVGRNWQSG